MSEASHSEASSEAAPTHLPEGEESPPAGVRVMAIARWALLLAMALLAALSLARSFGSLSAQHTHEIYTCPMHEAVRQDGPGACPICGMDLVPLRSLKGASTSSQAASARVIELPDARRQRLGVKTEKVERARRTASLSALGIVSEDEARVVRVHARSEGYVEELYVDQTFARVSQGKPLFSFYSPTWVAAQRELLAASKWAKDDDAPARALFTAARQKLLTLGVAESDIATVLAAAEPSHALVVRAPAGGTVTVKNVVRGSYVEQGALLFELTDLSEVWVQVEVPQIDAHYLKPGLAASVQVAGESTPRASTVALVYPTADSTRRSVRLRLSLANRDLALRPGLSARVSLTLPEIDGLFVPRDAVIDSGSERYVFASRDGVHFARVSVDAEPLSADLWHVRSGLVEGEEVVTTGSFLVDSETRLRGTEQDNPNKALPAQGSTP